MNSKKQNARAIAIANEEEPVKLGIEGGVQHTNCKLVVLPQSSIAKFLKANPTSRDIEDFIVSGKPHPIYSHSGYAKGERAITHIPFFQYRLTMSHLQSMISPGSPDFPGVDTVVVSRGRIENWTIYRMLKTRRTQRKRVETPQSAETTEASPATTHQSTKQKKPAKGQLRWVVVKRAQHNTVVSETKATVHSVYVPPRPEPLPDQIPPGVLPEKCRVGEIRVGAKPRAQRKRWVPVPTKDGSQPTTESPDAAFEMRTNQLRAWSESFAKQDTSPYCGNCVSHMRRFQVTLSTSCLQTVLVSYLMNRRNTQFICRLPEGGQFNNEMFSALLYGKFREALGGPCHVCQTIEDSQSTDRDDSTDITSTPSSDSNAVAPVTHEDTTSAASQSDGTSEDRAADNHDDTSGDRVAVNHEAIITFDGPCHVCQTIEDSQSTDRDDSTDITSTPSSDSNAVAPVTHEDTTSAASQSDGTSEERAAVNHDDTSGDRVAVNHEAIITFDALPTLINSAPVHTVEQATQPSPPHVPNHTPSITSRRAFGSTLRQRALRPYATRFVTGALLGSEILVVVRRTSSSPFALALRTTTGRGLGSSLLLCCLLAFPAIPVAAASTFALMPWLIRRSKSRNTHAPVPQLSPEQLYANLLRDETQAPVPQLTSEQLYANLLRDETETANTNAAGRADNATCTTRTVRGMGFDGKLHHGFEYEYPDGLCYKAIFKVAAEARLAIPTHTFNLVYKAFSEELKHEGGPGTGMPLSYVETIIAALIEANPDCAFAISHAEDRVYTADYAPDSKKTVLFQYSNQMAHITTVLFSTAIDLSVYFGWNVDGEPLSTDPTGITVPYSCGHVNGRLLGATATDGVAGRNLAHTYARPNAATRIAHGVSESDRRDWRQRLAVWGWGSIEYYLPLTSVEAHGRFFDPIRQTRLRFQHLSNCRTLLQHAPGLWAPAYPGVILQNEIERESELVLSRYPCDCDRVLRQHRQNLLTDPTARIVTLLQKRTIAEHGQAQYKWGTQTEVGIFYTEKNYAVSGSLANFVRQIDNVSMCAAGAAGIARESLQESTVSASYIQQAITKSRDAQLERQINGPNALRLTAESNLRSLPLNDPEHEAWLEGLRYIVAQRVSTPDVDLTGLFRPRLSPEITYGPTAYPRPRNYLDAVLVKGKPEGALVSEARSCVHTVRRGLCKACQRNDVTNPHCRCCQSPMLTVKIPGELHKRKETVRFCGVCTEKNDHVRRVKRMSVGLGCSPPLAEGVYPCMPYRTLALNALKPEVMANDVRLKILEDECGFEKPQPGAALYGIAASGCSPVVTRHDVKNVTASLIGRQFKRQITPDANLVQDYVQHSRALAEVFADAMVEANSGCPIKPMKFANYIMRFPPQRRAEIIGAMRYIGIPEKQIEQVAQESGVKLPKDTLQTRTTGMFNTWDRSTFLKRELLNWPSVMYDEAAKLGRIITANGSYVPILRLGPTVQAVTAVFKKIAAKPGGFASRGNPRLQFACGLDAGGLGALFEATFLHPFAIGLDFAKFDASQQAHHHEVERALYTALQHRESFSKKALTVFDHQRDNKTTVKMHGKVVVKASWRYRRNSGDANTTLGNSWLNASMLMWATKRICAQNSWDPERFTVSVGGDDGMIGSDYDHTLWTQDLERLLLGLGMAIELDAPEDKRSVQFMGAMAYYQADGSLRAGPVPSRFLAKVAWSVDEQVDYLAWNRGVALGWAKSFGHVPFVDNYTSAVLKLVGKGGHTLTDRGGMLYHLGRTTDQVVSFTDFPPAMQVKSLDLLRSHLRACGIILSQQEITRHMELVSRVTSLPAFVATPLTRAICA